MPSLTLVEDTAAVSNAGSTGALSSGKPEAAKEAAPQIRPATRAAEPASPASAKPPTPVEPALKPAPPKAAPAAPAAPPKPAAAANEAPATGNPAAVKPAATAAPEAEKPKPHPMDTSGQNIGSGLPKGPWQFPPVGADAKRLEAVRNGFVHAWRGYEKHAWGRDEVRPVSKSGGDPFGGMGATIVDSLDVLWLMGLRDEFNRSRDWVRDHLRFDNKGDVSVFETTIRVLGGLMSAHDLSGDPVFLDKAKQLADRLLPAFRTPSGLPQATVSLSSGRAHNPGWAGGMNCLAEIATLQLEFTQVSHNSGDPKYAKAAQAVIEAMDKMNPPHGLFATNVDTGAGRFVGESVTFGARGDSGFEYFAKMWVLLGKGEEAAMYRRLYDKAMDGVVSKLLQRSTPGGLLYIAEMEGYRNLRHKMDHLACFAPAMLALGAQGAPPNRTAAAELHMLAARELMVTCVEMYRRQPTGLAPELVHFRAGSDFTTDSWHNLLRPETVESLFYLWRYTHDPQYREWGWEIFQAFEKHARTEVAYSGIRDVRKIPPALDDRMESFFMAETMKYLYLLFCDDDVIPLDEYVFNTEAHPLRVHRKPAAPAPAPAPDAEEE